METLNWFWETNSLTNILSVFSILLAFAALLISLYYSKKSYLQAVKLNNINIEIDYYKRIFDDYILDHIPNLRKRLRVCPDNKLPYDVCMEFEQVLVKLLSDVEFFAYRNREFYDKLRYAILRIDDYIVENTEVIFDEEKTSVFYQKLDRKIYKLYSQIFKAALGE